MADTISIWPGDREDVIEDLEERVDNRNQAILDAIELYLAVLDIVGEHPLWAEADARARRAMLRQALIDYRQSHLEG